MVLPIEEQVDDGQIAQVPTAPNVEVLIQLLRDAAHRALAQPTRPERVLVERTDILGRQAADIHAAHQAFEIGCARPQPVRHRRPKGFLGPPQLGHRERQHPGLTLHLFRFVAVAPANPLPPPVAPPANQC